MALELSPDHRAWVVENLLAGVEQKAIVATLAKQISRTRAKREVSAIAKSPLLDVCGRLAKRARQLELVAALGRAHLASEPARTEVERRTTPTAEEFFRAYWAAHRPVVLTDVTARWPALRKWTPAWFRRVLGDVTIEITAGREADPNYDMNYRAHRKRVRMDRFIDQVTSAGTTNDIYMVSNNHTMKRPRFAALLKDVKPPKALFDPPRANATSLWIGPAGTVTPLHHDTTNILFCQIYGRKRFELVSPQETALLLDPVHGFYSPVDLDRRAKTAHPALRAMTVKSVVVGPGDALYIPAGWWHRVTSLDVSISFSLLGFRRPNDFDWYRPGHVS
ncbi:MAG: cupin-like domain-containing protein [Myxococcota bacterium]|nr:cupin-like domain-containing protein [Myxococcota bacterium]